MSATRPTPASSAMSAHEEHGIGEATFEQLREDVVRLSRLSDTGTPLPAFLDMHRVRSRIYRLLDRRLWPREQTDLASIRTAITHYGSRPGSGCITWARQ